MTRLEKKCFVGSATLHGSLLAAFLLGSAFVGARKPEQLPPVITMLAIPTDRLLSSGGNPKGNPEPPAPAPEQRIAQPPPQPEPVKDTKPVEPEPPKLLPKPVDPPKEIVKDVPKEKGELPTPKAKQEKKQVAKKETPPKANTAKSQINTNVVKIVKADAEARRQKELQAQRDRDFRRQMAEYERRKQALEGKIGGIIGGVGKSLSQATVVEPLGPGGAAFVNYGSLVREIYDRAWVVPPSLVDDDSTARAEIVIARDGRVVSAKLIGRSGNSTLDKSVQSALDSVRIIAPFPDGTRDTQRTFNINFNLRAKRFSA